MKVVWKYAVPLDQESHVVAMPMGATVLTLQLQGNVPCLWALVDPAMATQPRRFRWVGTGHEITGSGAGMHYIGTCQVGGSRPRSLQIDRGWPPELTRFAFHLFEDEGEKEKE